MRIRKLYLSGSIEGLTFEEASKERDKATLLLSKIGIETLDPMRGKEAFKGTGAIGVDNKNFEMQEIIDRDLTDIRECDGIIVLTGDHASWGTAMEFAYCKFVEHKPVFMIAQKNERIGWANFLATKISASIEELVDYLEKFWR